ncbi:MAG: hypothetical protein ACJ758_04735 [Actinomycetota bacterium]
MLVFILILLLLAAAFGVLAVVVKTALIIALSITLAVIFLGAIAYYYGRHRVNRFRREVERRTLPPGAP